MGKIKLACEICLNINYTIQKQIDREKRMEANKFCKRCNKHTIHKETK